MTGRVFGDPIPNGAPRRPGIGYIWDAQAEEWVFSEARAYYEIRKKRNRLLAETDYTQMPDYIASNPDMTEAWKQYRQALRDFPEACDLQNPVWPKKPQKKRGVE